jgi:protocatechuate 3,4-dioxygenase beta subunit
VREFQQAAITPDDDAPVCQVARCSIVSQRFLSRRHVLGGLGALVLAGCPRPRSSVATDAPPTPMIPDDDPPPPMPNATCEPTADNIEGPFFKPGAPHRAVLTGDGERLVLGGRVVSTSCAALVGVTLELWHADARGEYDNAGFGFRAALSTDADGRWQLSTIVPGRYLNGRRYRPSHIHAKLHAPGHRELTTQLYFEGDPYIAGDPFVVESLVMPHRSDGGVRRAGFDFVLESG